MYIKKPMEIENKSMDIIDESLKDVNFEGLDLQIARRMIHTTGDVDYRHIISFKNNFSAKALEAIKNGGTIYSDTNMIIAGVNKPALAAASCDIITLVSDKDIAAKAKEQGTTRSLIAIEEAVARGIRMFAIGNAPTALFRLIELIREGKCDPLFVIGVPVGFVGAAESKEELRKVDVPQITTVGTKGGSNVAASIINAILYENNRQDIYATK